MSCLKIINNMYHLFQKHFDVEKGIDPQKMRRTSVVQRVTLPNEKYMNIGVWSSIKETCSAFGSHTPLTNGNRRVHYRRTDEACRDSIVYVQSMLSSSRKPSTTPSSTDTEVSMDRPNSMLRRETAAGATIPGQMVTV